ncbi:MAG: DUF4328 domain-containing protein [Pyrinomonadaceae bacterium]
MNSYVSAHSRARVTKALLIAGAIVSAASMLVSVLELLFPPISDDDQLSDNLGGYAIALLQMGLGSLQLLIYVATVVFFLMWLYRSYENLPALGVPVRSIDYSSGWAVGSFFVPFVNLVVPYRAVKELWRKSAPAAPSFLQSDNPAASFPLWWLFWISSNIADNIYFRVAFRSDISREVIALISLISDALSILAAIFAIAVVPEIDRRQEQARKTFGPVQSPRPPPPPPTIFESTPETAAPS